MAARLEDIVATKALDQVINQQLPLDYLEKYNKRVIEHLQQTCELFTVVLYDNDDAITNVVKVYPLITSKEIVNIIYDEFYESFKERTDQFGTHYEEISAVAYDLYRLIKEFIKNGLLNTSTYHPFPYYEQGFDDHPDVGMKEMGELQENGLFEIANYSLDCIKNELMTDFKAKYSTNAVYRFGMKEMKIVKVSNVVEITRPPYN